MLRDGKIPYSDETIDGKSKSKAYALFDSSLLDTIEVGSVKGLQQIHDYLFGGLYDFAGRIRRRTIAKSDFHFAMARFLDMPEHNAPRIRCDRATDLNLMSANTDTGPSVPPGFLFQSSPENSLRIT